MEVTEWWWLWDRWGCGSAIGRGALCGHQIPHALFMAWSLHLISKEMEPSVGEAQSHFSCGRATASTELVPGSGLRAGPRDTTHPPGGTPGARGTSQATPSVQDDSVVADPEELHLGVEQ